MQQLIPCNDVETALVKASRGEIPDDQFLWAFLASTIAMPSATEAGPGGKGLTPVVFDRAGQPMIAVFTTSERAGMYADMAPFVLLSNAHAFLAGLLPQYGVVVNPG